MKKKKRVSFRREDLKPVDARVTWSAPGYVTVEIDQFEINFVLKGDELVYTGYADHASHRQWDDADLPGHMLRRARKAAQAELQARWSAAAH